eukprot:1492003-Pyramimonas_sp.AAC.1
MGPERRRARQIRPTSRNPSLAGWPAAAQDDLLRVDRAVERVQDLRLHQGAALRVDRHVDALHCDRHDCADLLGRRGTGEAVLDISSPSRSAVQVQDEYFRPSDPPGHRNGGDASRSS